MIIEANKWRDSEKFWYIIKEYVRPIVLFELDDGVKIPLNDFDYDESIKISSLSVNSPFQAVIEGLAGPIIELVIGAITNGLKKKKEEEMKSNEYINRQIGQTLQNVEGFIRTSELLSNSDLDPGLKIYAGNTLCALMKKQEELNEKIGIDTDSINLQLHKSERINN